jgi:hypothetical protein
MQSATCSVCLKISSCTGQIICAVLIVLKTQPDELYYFKMEIIPRILLLLLLLLCYNLYAKYLQLCTWNKPRCSYSVVIAYGTLKVISHAKILLLSSSSSHCKHREYISGSPSQFFCLLVRFFTYHSYILNTKPVTKLGRTREVYLWQHSVNFSLQLLLEQFFCCTIAHKCLAVMVKTNAEFHLRL